jgi:hypothetical protein
VTCNEWEVRIERRGHGALAADEAGELEAHLAECAPCRAYAGLARGSERTMQTAGAELGERIDWERVRAGVDHGARRARRELWVGAFFAMGITAVWVTIPPWQKVLASPVVVTVLLAALIPAAALCAIAFRHIRGRALSAGAARTSDGAALGWMREELDGRIRERRNVLFLEVAICALLAVVALLEQIPDEGSFRLWFVAGAAVVSGDAAWTAFRALPRLLRERNELG